MIIPTLSRLNYSSCQDDSMILCEPKVAKPRKDPYERSLAELRLFPDKNPATMNSLSYSRLGKSNLCIKIAFLWLLTDFCMEIQIQ